MNTTTHNTEAESATAGKDRAAAFTPGPWTEHDGFIIARFDSDQLVHDICDPRCAPADTCAAEIDANVRLILKTPTMHEALVQIALLCESAIGADEQIDNQEVLRMANAALEGRQP